ncbi:MAG: glycosyltransferase family 4 protein, partial [Chloroflexota bacterium]
MPEQAPLHVAMLVRNPYTHDSRVEKEAATLRDAGYRVTVMADAAPALPEREEKDGIAVRRIARRGPRIPGVSFMLHEWGLGRALTALRPDVLHAHDSNALLPVGIAARSLRRPFVYDAHDLWLHRPRRQRSRLYHTLQNAFFAIIERLFVPRAAVTLTVSAPIARHLEQRYRLARVDLVPNYPERPGVAVRREVRELEGLAHVPPSAPIVLYLGGLMGGRGIEYLVRSMAGVPAAHLVLLGSGHQGAELVAEARRTGVGERVHVLSPVPPEEVVDYASSATIGVSP